MGLRVASLAVITGLMILSPFAIAEETGRSESVDYVPVSASSEAVTERTVVVVPGDHLWKISARILEGTNRDVAGYWIEVVETNREHLRSGDPDLIFPGEVVSLPPVPTYER